MGSFGIIYKTENIETGEICATKFEKISKNRNGVSLLVREIKVLMVMKGCYGITKIFITKNNRISLDWILWPQLALQLFHSQLLGLQF